MRQGRAVILWSLVLGAVACMAARGEDATTRREKQRDGAGQGFVPSSRPAGLDRRPGERLRERGMGRGERRGGMRAGRNAPDDDLPLGGPDDSLLDGRPPGPLGPDDGASPPPFERGRALRPGDIDDLLAFIKMNFPEMHTHLQQARQESPRDFIKMLRNIGPPMLHLMRLSKEDPAAAEQIIEIQRVELQIRMLRRHYHDVRDEDERAAVRAEVRELVARRFDLRIERVRSEIAEMRRRLDEQTRRLAEEESHKSAIVESELADVFESPPGPPPGRGGPPMDRPGRGPASRPAGAGPR